MPRIVHQRRQVQAMMDDGAQVVDVLGPEEYVEAHLPGAVNLRLRDIDPESLNGLDPGRPVVVYCWDSA